MLQKQKEKPINAILTAVSVTYLGSRNVFEHLSERFFVGVLQCGHESFILVGQIGK